jgi:DNA repair protein RecO (recombination protein O)
VASGKRAHVDLGLRPFHTPAFVVRLVDYGESDRVVTLLTRGLGKVAALAKAARRSRKRFGAALQPFVLGEADLRERRVELFALDRFEPIRDLTVVTTDVARLAHAGYLTELVRELSPERAADAPVFDLYAEALVLIGERPARAELLRAFELRLLAALGLRPSLGRCAGCGGGAVGDQFDPARGGALCASCAPGALLLSRSAREALLTMDRLPFAEAAATRLAAEDNAQARSALIAFIEHHLGRRLRSPDFIAELGGRKG